MSHGHHGANHPVKEHSSGKVEITSMNHGFAVDAQTLPDGVEETHISLLMAQTVELKCRIDLFFPYNITQKQVQDHKIAFIYLTNLSPQ
jgi:hypothetical protein